MRRLDSTHFEVANGIIIERCADGFRQHLHNEYVREIWSYYIEHSECVLYYKDGRRKQLNIGCSSFNSQFGTPVSEDGKHIFINKWSSGLYSFCTETGLMDWKAGEKFTHEFILFRRYITLMHASKGLLKIDSESGEIIDELKDKTFVSHYHLSDSLIAVSTSRNTLEIVDSKSWEHVGSFNLNAMMEELGKITVTWARCDNERIIAEGFKTYPEDKVPRFFEISVPFKFTFQD